MAQPEIYDPTVMLQYMGKSQLSQPSQSQSQVANVNNRTEEEDFSNRNNIEENIKVIITFCLGKLQAILLKYKFRTLIFIIFSSLEKGYQKYLGIKIQFFPDVGIWARQVKFNFFW